jgi:hypothetical protein
MPLLGSWRAWTGTGPDSSTISESRSHSPPLGRDAPAPDRRAARPRIRLPQLPEPLPVPLPAGAGLDLRGFGAVILTAGNRPDYSSIKAPVGDPAGFPSPWTAPARRPPGCTSAAFHSSAPDDRRCVRRRQDTARVAGAVRRRPRSEARARGPATVADVRFCPRWAAADGARGWGRPITHSCPCKGLGCSQPPRFPWSGRTALTDAGAGRDFRPLSDDACRGRPWRK